MDGATLIRLTEELLNEDPSTSIATSDRVTYEFLWQAATEFVNRTTAMKSTQSITTVADQKAYVLKADHVRLYQRNNVLQLFLKINDGSFDHFSVEGDESQIALDVNSTSLPFPERFYILDHEPDVDQRTGTATTPDGTAANGETTLTAAAAEFETWDIQPGDTIHNTTTGASGYVLSITSDTALVAALFGGTGQDFTIDDTFLISQQARLQIIFHQPPSVAGYTVTLPYVQRPKPVYSPFRRYRIQDQYMPAIPNYAAFLYKYRDKQPDFGDKWFLFWDRKCREAGRVLNKSLGRTGFRVNMIGRGSTSKRSSRG